MQSDPLGNILGKLIEAGITVHRSGDGYSCRCPAHDDRNASLSLHRGADGHALVHCHAGCSYAEVMNSLGLDDRAGFADSPLFSANTIRPTDRKPAEAITRLWARAEASDGSDAASTLSVALGLPVASCEVLGVRYLPDAAERVWLLPERDAQGVVVGLTRRWADGSKRAVKGSRRGLTIIDADPARDGPVLIVEGASDTLACHALGIRAVGRPSADGGADLLPKWIGDREAIVMGESDDGRGVTAAPELAAKLTEALGRPIGYAYPPDGVKDCRQWCREEILGPDHDAGQWHEAGARFLDAVRTSVQFVSIAKGDARLNRIRKPLVFLPVSALGPSEPPSWVWPGYIARGSSTLLCGLWKSGKSTLVSHLLRDLGKGGGLVGEPIDDPVLVMSEESSGQWSKRRDDLGLGDNIHVCPRPFTGKPSMAEWVDAIERIAEHAKRINAALVVVDTLASCWPVADENDAGQVMAALSPMNAITEAGAGLLLIHHPRKGDAGEGQASRGSGALPGFVDAIVELRRYRAEDAHDRRRKLTAYGRFDDIVPEAVVEMGEGGYRMVGTVAEATEADLDDTIDAVLREAGEAITANAIHEAWPTDLPPGITKLRAHLNRRAANGTLQRFGAGVRNDAHMYARIRLDREAG